jgi:hypothetical protein
MQNFLSNLIPNLISEALGILTTVLIVDRLLNWREKRRWRCVRKVFLAEADKAIDTIIDAWRDWISVLGDGAAHAAQKVDATGLADRAQTFEAKLSNFSHLARKCEVNYSFFPPPGVLRINELMRGFTEYAEERLPYFQDLGWSQLHKEMKMPVQKLSDLLDRYAMLVDPNFALPVIRLSEELDNLKSGRYERLSHFFANGARLARHSNVNETARRETAALIDSAIRETLRLKYYVRRNLGKELMETPFERVARVAGLDPVLGKFKKQTPPRSRRTRTTKPVDQMTGDRILDLARNDIPPADLQIGPEHATTKTTPNSVDIN